MEFFGTMIFVLCIVGIARTGNTMVPLYIGWSLATLIYIGAGVSGSHYNPAVTLSLWLRKKISNIDAIKYILSQLLWALVAYLVAKQIFHFTLPAIDQAYGANSLLGIFVAELIFTFTFITAVFHTAVAKQVSWNNYFGLTIGWVVVMGVAVVGPISGWFFNPAVLFGLSFYGNSFAIVWTILLAHIVAAVSASNFYWFTIWKE